MIALGSELHGKGDSDSQTPIPSQDHDEADLGCESTTGEINLYADITTLGSATPCFFADCEGQGGGSYPVAAQHQTRWSSSGGSKRYKTTKNIDRATAASTLYPRFVYIVSDVICYVTNSSKAWTRLVAQLIEWSEVGSKQTINQAVLPALIVIVNGGSNEREAWLGGSDAFTDTVFSVIEKEFNGNHTLKAKAEAVSGTPRLYT